MKQPPNLTPVELKESVRKLQSRSFLEAVGYQSLIDETEQCLLTSRIIALYADFNSVGVPCL